MRNKRNLLNELNITNYKDDTKSPLDVDVEKIKKIVNKSIDSAHSERKIIMKSKRKLSVIAVAAVLILGITAFASGGIIKNWYSNSSSIPEYKSLPTAEQCVKDVGYEVVLIEAFENGYTFKNGSVIDNELTDENNTSVEKFKSVMFRYEKDGDTVNFSQEKFNSEIDCKGDIIADVNGVEVYYYSYMNKLVPADYKMTEEDKKAKENGEIVFSWGTEAVDIVKVQTVQWVENDVHYLLMQMNGELSSEELAEMAEEIIKAK